MSEATTRCEHHLVVGRPEAGSGVPQMLLVGGPDGWALPRLESENQRAADVTHIARAARALLGVEVSVLRCLLDTSGGGVRRQVHDLESHATRWALPPGGRWIARSDLDAIRLARPEHRRILDDWFRGRAAPPSAPDGRDWVCPGWRDRVIAWVGEELSRRGLGGVREVEQVRVWEFSQVLRIRTAEVELYFKALPHSGAIEPRLTAYLARLFPPWTPAVIAAEPGQGWLLMTATTGPGLMSVSDLARWEQAAATYARLQLDCAERVADLTALGCPRRPLAWLEGEIDALLEDTRAMQPDDPEALTDAELETVRALGPEIHSMARALAAHDLPLSLEHGDLWAENVIAGDPDCVFIDWEDACVGPAFFSAFLLLASVDYTEALPDRSLARRRIGEAYLMPWRKRLDGRRAEGLDGAFALSQQLAAVHYAAQFRVSSLARVETSREVRGFVPLFLRRLLRARGLGEPTAGQ